MSGLISLLLPMLQVVVLPGQPHWESEAENLAQVIGVEEPQINAGRVSEIVLAAADAAGPRPPPEDQSAESEFLERLQRYKAANEKNATEAQGTEEPLPLNNPNAVTSVPPHVFAGEIRFEGNHKTRNGILRNELYLQSGDPVSTQKLEESRQAIMNLGIFNAVTVRLEPNSQPSTQDIVFVVQEKRFYILPLPRGNLNQEGDASLGLELEWSNFLGLNQVLSLQFDRDLNTAEKDRGNGSRLAGTFEYPAAFGTRLNMKLGGSYSQIPVSDKNPDNSVVEFDELDRRAFFDIGYRLTGLQTSGWSISGGPFYWSRRNDPISANAVPESGTSLLARLGTKYRKVDFNLYSETGLAFRTDFAQTLPLSSNDFEFTEWTAGVTWFTQGLGPLLDDEHHNLNYHFSFGVASGGPPRYEHFGLNARIARGSGDKGSVDGQAFGEVTVEYLFPVFGTRSVRLYTFFDVGNVWTTPEDVAIDDLRYSVGTGIRWRLKSFVNFELDLGLAFALNDGNYDFLAGSNRF